jgi:tetratricopeptide (TPR) repeat protein
MKKIALLLGVLLAQTVLATDSHISLTASDGSGLEMRSLKARVVIEGFLAFTELEMIFYNPENRRREGRFQIILPDNAAISRFAMKIGDRLQEGEIVEKQLARRAYEDFLHRRQDPALLETDSGNRFNARIFPIEAKSEKHLILSYSQRLKADYVLPLKGLPKLKQFSLKVFYDKEASSSTKMGELTATLSKRDIISIKKRNYKPSIDFKMPYRKTELAIQSKQLVAVKITPFTNNNKQTKQDFEQLIILVDTSASQAPYLSKTIERLYGLLPQLSATNLLLYSFDQEVIKIGVADNLIAQQALIKKLKKSQALGASRFDAPVNILKRLKRGKSRLLFISDAVITAGETSGTKLMEQLKSLSWLERVDILIPSAHNNRKIAESLTKAGQNQGVIASMTLSDAEIVRKLTSSVFSNIAIKVSGSNWYWPEKVEALQTNEPLIVFAELKNKSRHRKSLHIKVGNKHWKLTSKEANSILLKREWVRARLNKLLSMEDKVQDKDIKNAFHNEIINLSVKERVLSPYTSLLVLETENDYKRYNIDRKGLADILTIGADGLTVIKRTGIEPPPPIVIEKPIPLPSPTLNQSFNDNVMEKSSVNEAEEAEIAPLASSSIRRNSVSHNREAMVQNSPILEENGAAESDDLNGFASPPAPPAPAAMPQIERRRARISGESVISQDEVMGRPAPVLKKHKVAAFTGKYAQFRALLEKDDIKAAGKFAQQWRQANLADVMALIALGEWYEKTGNIRQAARAYGSLIDYFPARADIRRWASERLLAIKSANWLSVDSLKKAVEERPDHPSGHYLLAIAQWQAGEFDAAKLTLETAIKRNYPRFQAAKRILKETLSLMQNKQKHRQLRLILMWETDANDVDFHIYDKQENHAYYSQKNLATGGSLYADITTGYGPECFTISKPKAYPYKVQAHYYRRGPMGYGMGVLHILKYDPKTGLNSVFRPFVVMKDGAFVELGQIK